MPEIVGVLTLLAIDLTIDLSAGCYHLVLESYTTRMPKQVKNTTQYAAWRIWLSFYKPTNQRRYEEYDRADAFRV